MVHTINNRKTATLCGLELTDEQRKEVRSASVLAVFQIYKPSPETECENCAVLRRAMARLEDAKRTDLGIDNIG